MHVWGSRVVVSALIVGFWGLLPVKHIEAAPAGAMVFDFTGPLNAQGVPTPWKLKVKSGDAQVAMAEERQRNVLHLPCKDASFAVERATKIDVRHAPVLTWTWKAVQLPPRGDVRTSDANDQVLQLLLGFDGKKVLSYIWDTQAPVGTVADESIGWPVSLTLKVLVVQSGYAAVGTWVSMTRNVLEDYRQLFGAEPPLLEGIRVQSNCQNSASTAEGYMGPIHLSPAPRTP